MISQEEKIPFFTCALNYILDELHYFLALIDEGRSKSF